MSDQILGRCWHCGGGLTRADLGRESACVHCGKDTRVCRNCRHYAPGRPNDCVEPMAERVLDKGRANFCELFEPTPTPAGTSPAPGEIELRKAAEDLFK